jgi:hypothetical protein
MALPTSLKDAIDDALQNIRNHPTHEFGPRNREVLFKIMDAIPSGQIARKWLGILTARKVLPIYEGLIQNSIQNLFSLAEKVMSDEVYGEEMYRQLDENQPQLSLYLAERVMSGEINVEQVYRLACDWHYTVGYMSENLPDGAALANIAANKALIEVSSPNFKPFDFLSDLHRVGFIDGEIDGFELKENYLNGEQFSDLIWANSGQSDTAAAAVSSWAFNSGEEFDTAKVLEFWEWWLLEAIPDAWEKASAPVEE